MNDQAFHDMNDAPRDGSYFFAYDRAGTRFWRIRWVGPTKCSYKPWATEDGRCFMLDHFAFWCPVMYPHWLSVNRDARRALRGPNPPIQPLVPK